MYIHIYIRRPLLVRGHQAANHMKLITVNQSWQVCYYQLTSLVSAFRQVCSQLLVG